jgi:hypothetical protein
MNFAPYQDDSPEVERALSPPPFADPFNRTKSPPAQQQQQQQQQQRSTPPPQPKQAPPNHYAHPNTNNGYIDYSASSSGFGNTPASDSPLYQQDYGGRADLGAFDTSLPLRMDYEAMLAYILLPPAGGVALLLLEHKSDYVRYAHTLCSYAPDT